MLGLKLNHVSKRGPWSPTGNKACRLFGTNEPMITHFTDAYMWHQGGDELMHMVPNAKTRKMFPFFKFIFLKEAWRHMVSRCHNKRQKLCSKWKNVLHSSNAILYATPCYTGPCYNGTGLVLRKATSIHWSPRVGVGDTLFHGLLAHP